MERPRLVASDVDGTLLDPMERVTTRTLRAIRRVEASGTPFVLVSGRPPRWIPRVAAAAGVRGYAVCANGAVLYDIGADRVLTVRGLDPVLLHDVVGALDAALPGCAVATERVGDSALAGAARQFLAEYAYQHPWQDGDHAAAPRAEVLGHRAVKLLIRHEGMNSEEMARAAAAVLDGQVHVTYSSGAGLLEVSAPGVTKATGLAEVAELTRVDAADVAAFGDMPNDVPMLRWAGHGVAVANAHPEALAAADEITAPNSEDGVALVLERWF
ncbi:HAD family hydrolase [Gandjariella thermophila]|uniref:Haloacid dehalogenase n=1 Tax=Gandjariella thermophila TaxID=1931992 RepID=A0A4D4JB71_9PSEU|nr:HAD family hydrolase [Gandjariella thermophila]GDY31207.1 haloacid dehalogenase [Gandjariella thermophila]